MSLNVLHSHLEIETYRLSPRNLLSPVRKDTIFPLPLKHVFDGKKRINVCCYLLRAHGALKLQMNVLIWCPFKLSLYGFDFFLAKDKGMMTEANDSC